MAKSDLKAAVLQAAKDCAAQGPGYSQDGVVLRAAAEQLKLGTNLSEQQALLTAWHDLFREGVLAWGYDIDNPSAPFFHFAQR
jgi:hypothetical protein